MSRSGYKKLEASEVQKDQSNLDDMSSPISNTSSSSYNLLPPYQDVSNKEQTPPPAYENKEEKELYHSDSPLWVKLYDVVQNYHDMAFRQEEQVASADQYHKKGFYYQGHYQDDVETSTLDNIKAWCKYRWNRFWANDPKIKSRITKNYKDTTSNRKKTARNMRHLVTLCERQARLCPAMLPDTLDAVTKAEKAIEANAPDEPGEEILIKRLHAQFTLLQPLLLSNLERKVTLIRDRIKSRVELKSTYLPIGLNLDTLIELLLMGEGSLSDELQYALNDQLKLIREHNKDSRGKSHIRLGELLQDCRYHAKKIRAERAYIQRNIREYKKDINRFAQDTHVNLHIVHTKKGVKDKNSRTAIDFEHVARHLAANQESDHLIAAFKHRLDTNELDGTLTKEQAEALRFILSSCSGGVTKEQDEDQKKLNILFEKVAFFNTHYRAMCQRQSDAPLEDGLEITARDIVTAPPRFLIFMIAWPIAIGEIFFKTPFWLLSKLLGSPKAAKALSPAHSYTMSFANGPLNWLAGEDNRSPKAKRRAQKAKYAFVAKHNSTQLGITQGSTSFAGFNGFFSELVPIIFISMPFALLVGLGAFLCNVKLVHQDTYDTLKKIFMGGLLINDEGEYILEIDNSSRWSTFKSYAKCVGYVFGLFIAIVTSVGAGFCYGVLAFNSMVGSILAPYVMPFFQAIGLHISALIPTLFVSVPAVATAIGLTALFFVVAVDFVVNIKARSLAIASHIAHIFWPGKDILSDVFYKCNAKINGSGYFAVPFYYAVNLVSDLAKLGLAITLCVLYTAGNFGAFYENGRNIMHAVSSGSWANTLVLVLTYSNSFISGVFGLKKNVDFMNRVTAGGIVTFIPRLILSILGLAFYFTEKLIRNVALSFAPKVIAGTLWGLTKVLSFGYLPVKWSTARDSALSIAATIVMTPFWSLAKVLSFGSLPVKFSTAAASLKGTRPKGATYIARKLLQPWDWISKKIGDTTLWKPTYHDPIKELNAKAETLSFALKKLEKYQFTILQHTLAAHEIGFEHADFNKIIFTKSEIQNLKDHLKLAIRNLKKSRDPYAKSLIKALKQIRGKLVTDPAYEETGCAIRDLEDDRLHSTGDILTGSVAVNTVGQALLFAGDADAQQAVMPIDMTTNTTVCASSIGIGTGPGSGAPNYEAAMAFVASLAVPHTECPANVKYSPVCAAAVEKSLHAAKATDAVTSAAEVGTQKVDYNETRLFSAPQSAEKPIQEKPIQEEAAPVDSKASMPNGIFGRIPSRERYSKTLTQKTSSATEEDFTSKMYPVQV